MARHPVQPATDRYVMGDGITFDGREVRIDTDTVRKAHDINENDENCATCGVEYPCGLREAVDVLDDWLRAQRAASATPR